MAGPFGRKEGDPVSRKYLEKYAEPIALKVAQAARETYQAAVVVPVYGEPCAAFSRLTESAPGPGKNLVIFVVNAPVEAPPLRVEQNEAFLKFARASGDVKAATEGVEWIFQEPGADVLLLDVTREPLRLRPKEGVGRARKIGLDVALALYMGGRIHSPMCGTTDADVTLPQGYFMRLGAEQYQPRQSLPHVSGLLFPYRHVLPEASAARTLMTELEVSFRYYVLGLHHARSPYAYHTLGSALGVSLPHYARVRGVPNRQAGEDFHLLAKLSKLAPLARLTDGAIEIETRVSDRVPFGTGPSLIKALSDPEQKLKVHHPMAFVWLLEVLKVLAAAVEANIDVPLTFSDELPAFAQRHATDVYRRTLPHLTACPSAAHRVRRLHERFDALATLQFIHDAHRNGLERVDIAAAFELSGFLPTGLRLEEQLQYCVQKEHSLDLPAGLLPA